MYEKDGEKYFVFDGHLHFWDASPENWKPRAEEYAKGWIECFYAYMGLAPAETHWSLEQFQKYSWRTSRRTCSTTGMSTWPCCSRRTCKRVVHERLQRHRQERRRRGAVQGQADPERPLGSA